MLKEILLTARGKINQLELREQELMKDCVNKKLERSLADYESHLEDTCKYILTKNPITTIKAMVTEPPKKKKEDND